MTKVLDLGVTLNRLAEAAAAFSDVRFLEHQTVHETNETGLAIGNAREFNAVTADQLRFLAVRAGASPKLMATAADGMADRFISEWQRFGNEVSPNLRTVIDGQGGNVPLLRERQRSRSLRM